MKHEEAFKKALRTFRDVEKDALLRLAILKERADYRKYFTPELRKAVESAYSKMEEAAEKGPGHFADDEEVHNTSANFLGTLRHRFGIRQLRIPPHFTSAEWLDVLDPLVDVKAIPARTRQRVLPRLFYTRGVRELVPKSVPPSDRPLLEIGGETTSSDCAPYERLWKIDLRKKPSVLLREFKASLAAVDARRGIDPAAYKAWKQDRSRKRKEAWDQLEVWKLRRQRKGFGQIARTLRIKVGTAKMSFYSAYKLIEGRPYDREKYKLGHWNLRECATCQENPDRGGTCKELCPDMEALAAGSSVMAATYENIDQIQATHSRDEWFTREARELQTKEDEQD